MSRMMSCAETEQAVVDRVKTETRRLGWWEDKNGRRLLHPGDRLTLVRKAMGRKRRDGTVEPLVRLAEVEVTSVHREPLLTITNEGVAAEGVDPAKWKPYSLAGRRADWHAWAMWFADTMRCAIDDDVTVIRWRYLDGCADSSLLAWGAHLLVESSR